MLSRTDEIDLLTALHEGPHETPHWATFLARMRRRTRADRATLTIGERDAPIHPAMRWSADSVDQAVAAHERYDAIDAAPCRWLRPGRVYSAAELVDPEITGYGRPPSDPRFGRFMRVTAPAAPSLWLSLTRADEDFAAADSALLSSLGPHLGIALRTLVALERGRFREATADDILVRAGIGWTVRDREGRTVETGGAAGVTEGEASLALAAAERPLAGAIAPDVVMVSRRAPRSGPDMAAMLQRQFGLSPSEARLAVRLSDGQSLAGAAAALGLTIETARNYSKRLFAKTGTRSQADLVRLVLSGVAWLA